MTAAALVVLVALPAGAQAQAGTGTVTGTVTADGGGALQGICVTVFDDFDDIGFGQTNASGVYTINGVAAGSGYTVRFEAGTGCGGQNYVNEWHNNRLSEDDADPVTVPDGGTTTLNAGLAPGGGITGTVTQAGAPDNRLMDICVDVERVSDGYYEYGETNASGVYAVDQLPAGSYKVFFYNCNGGNYVDEWYDDKTSYNQANSVTVTVGGAPTVVNEDLAVGGIITGTVSDASGPLEYVCVSALDSNGDYIEETETSDGDTESDPSAHPLGFYAIEGLPTGAYRIYFDPSCSDEENLAPEYYDNEISFSQADPVSVTAGAAVSSINAVMDPSATISGTVTYPHPTSAGTTVSASSVCVSVYSDADPNEELGFGFTNGLGNYTISGLHAGSYKLEFGGTCADTPAQGLVSEWWNNQPDFTSATPINLTGGGSAPNTNATLDRGGMVTGFARDQTTNAPLVDICVTALHPTNPDRELDFALTEADGSFELRGLPEPNVKLLFEDCDGGTYLDEYYNNSATYANATTVSVTAGSTTSGIVGLLNTEASGPLPTVTITGGPSTTSDPRPVFTFSTTNATSVQCSITAGSATPVYGGCTGANSHQPASALAPGTYTLHVKAFNASGDDTAVHQFAVTAGTGGTGGGGTGGGDTDDGDDGDAVDEVKCEKAEDKLDAAKDKLKKLKEQGASKKKIKKAKDKVKDAKEDVKDLC